MVELAGSFEVRPAVINRFDQSLVHGLEEFVLTRFELLGWFCQGAFVHTFDGHQTVELEGQVLV